MPNWCSNHLEINGPKEKIKDLFDVAKNSDGLLETMAPIGKWDYNDAVTDGTHWSRLKFGKAQFNAEKPYKRPLALFNGFNTADGVFIKFKKFSAISENTKSLSKPFCRTAEPPTSSVPCKPIPIP